MKLIIHDLKEKAFQELFPELLGDIKVIADDTTIKPCIGCFGCWVKTPGMCIIKDGYSHMGEYLSRSDEVILISRCTYGGFSPFVKNVLDRSISYIHPYFEIRNGEMHHKHRYDHHFNLKVWFYGQDISDLEKKTAEGIVKSNSINMNCKLKDITFVQDSRIIQECIL